MKDRAVPGLSALAVLQAKKHTHGSQRRLDEIILRCDFAETTLTSRLGGCTTLRLWGNQN